VRRSGMKGWRWQPNSTRKSRHRDRGLIIPKHLAYVKAYVHIHTITSL